VRTLTGANIGNYTRFSPDRQHFISYNGLEPFSLWRTSDGQRIPLKTMPFRGGDRGVFFPDNQTVAVVWPELVAIWSLDDGSELPRVALPAGSPLSKSPVFAIAADGKKAANLRYGDEKSELFSLPEGELIRTFDLEEASAGLFPNPGRPQFSPDGSLLAVSTGSDSVMLWRVEDGGLVAHLTSGGDKRYPDAGFSAMAFSPDGKEFVGRSQAGAIRFWKLP
jgi:WD40 repeat protein